MLSAKRVLFLMAVVFLPLLPAQDLSAPQPGVAALRQEVEALRTAMEAQKAQFQKELSAMQGRLDEQDRTQLGRELESAVNTLAGDVEVSRWPLVVATGQRNGNIALSGSMRMRFEGRGRNVDFDRNGLDDSGTRMDGRIMLGFDAEVAAGSVGSVNVHADLQAAGRFANNTAFDFSGPNTIALPAQFSFFDTPFETVMLYQGFVELCDVLGDDTALRFGRQEFVRGSQFVLGNNDFYSGLAHDGLSARWDCAEHQSSVSAFLFTEGQSDGTLSVTTPGDDMNDDIFGGLYVSLAPAENFALDIYALRFNGRSNDTDSFVTLSPATGFDGAWTPAIRGRFWTVGARAAYSGLDFAGGALALSAEVAAQNGSRDLDPLSSGGLVAQDIEGVGAEFMANWWVDPGSDLNPIFSLAWYSASGGSANPGTANGWPAAQSGFNPLFMNRHMAGGDRNDVHAPYFAGGGRYGNLDLIPLDNMQVFKAAVSIAADDDVELGLAWNAAWIADDVGYGGGRFGSELDLFGVWTCSDAVQISADLSFFFPSAGATNQATWMFFAPGGGAGDDTALGCFVQALVRF